MRSSIRLCAWLCALLLATACFAADSASREASKHFQRGVELYTDGDFRGALVEFRKAYVTWPRANVLYDIGQTEYQLMDYATALKTMERYLAETGPNAAHRAEVESTVEVLRGRVGRIVLTTDAPDCEVTVDEQPVGTTPVAGSILVSVGSRRVTVACAGRPAVSRRVDLTAGELARLDIKLPPPTIAALRGAGASVGARADRPPTRTGMALGWSVSAVLLAATIGVGTAALVEQSRLDGLKATYPVSRDALDSQASLTTGLAISSDAIGAATLAAVGASIFLTVKYVKAQRKIRLGWSGGRLSLSSTF